MNQLCKKFVVFALFATQLHATWENDMMRQFIFNNTTAINNVYPFEDGTDPVWAVVASFDVDVADYDDSGLVFLNVPILFDGVSATEGVFALRLDGTTLIGLSPDAVMAGTTDGWGIDKWRIWAPSVVPPEFGWTILHCMQWPLNTSILTVGSHTIELLASMVYCDFDETGFSFGAGASIAFIGMPNSTISQTAP